MSAASATARFCCTTEQHADVPIRDSRSKRPARRRVRAALANAKSIIARGGALVRRVDCTLRRGRYLLSLARLRRRRENEDIVGIARQMDARLRAKGPKRLALFVDHPLLIWCEPAQARSAGQARTRFQSDFVFDFERDGGYLSSLLRRLG